MASKKNGKKNGKAKAPKKEKTKLELLDEQLSDLYDEKSTLEDQHYELEDMYPNFGEEVPIKDIKSLVADLKKKYKIDASMLVISAQSFINECKRVAKDVGSLQTGIDKQARAVDKKITQVERDKAKEEAKVNPPEAKHDTFTF